MAAKTKYGIIPPVDTPEYLWPAYFSALRVAIEEPVIIKAFSAETGYMWSAPKSPMDAMIDEATGYAEGYIKAFVEWFNINVWGPM
jgi:hypothetical protein